MSKRVFSVCAVSASVVVGAVILASAGPLDPPAGPVAPTHKTLSEVEPRTPINASTCPGDANSVYRITKPGPYYVASNQTGVSAKHGIEIAADGVTIDLGGFELVGVPGSLDGITTDGVRGRVTIRNGSVGGWGGAGIDLTAGGAGEGSVVEHVTASGNAETAIRVGAASAVRWCAAMNSIGANAGGFEIGDHSIVESCSAHNNNGNGIMTGMKCTVMGCSADFNGADGIHVDDGTAVTSCSVGNNLGRGMLAGASSTVANCSSYYNADVGLYGGAGNSLTGCGVYGNGDAGIVTGFGSVVTACSAGQNGGTGILAQGWTVVENCSAFSNDVHGISATNDCRISNNRSTGNGLGSSTGAGIALSASDSTVTGNVCTDNEVGVIANASGNMIARNVCSGNDNNWSIVAGNVCLVVQATSAGAIVGNSGGAAPGSTDPNANFTY